MKLTIAQAARMSAGECPCGCGACMPCADGSAIIARPAEEMRAFRVRLRSVPGMWATYSGAVDVAAFDVADAKEKALDELRRGAFSDRPRDGWRIESVLLLERCGHA